MTEQTQLRTDQALIAEWIAPKSRVLDLGCGDGILLAHLQRERGVSGYGLEIDIVNIIKCIERGINVIQTNLDSGLSDFDEDSFDYVVMTQTLQATRYPHLVMREMLRVGREGIVTFPNMAHWRARWHLACGRMPVTRSLPHEWYDTQNLHLCTLADFEDLCRREHIEILQRAAVDHAHRSSLGMSLFPNLLGEVALYRIRRHAAAR